MNKFSIKRTVTIGDTDQFGIVYYLNYLKWCSEARDLFAFQHVDGFPHQFLISVIDMETKFYQPARLQDEFEVEIFLAPTRRKTTVYMYFNIIRESDQQIMATHRQTLAFRDLSGRIIKLPAVAIQLVQQFEIDNSNSASSNCERFEATVAESE